MKKKPQSQRKTPSKILYERNMPKNNKYSYVNSFRQIKDSKYFFTSKDHIKKKLISNQDSPRTIDYMQVMRKYEHLIEQNSENKKNEKENYFKTDYNIKQNHLVNNNLINFCRTDDNNKTGGINNIIYLDYEKGKNKGYKNIRNFFNDKIEMDKNKMNNFYDKNEEHKKNNNTCKITKKNISFNSQSYSNLNNIKTNINQSEFYKKFNNNKSFSFFRGLLNQENNNETKNSEININNNLFKEKIKSIISLCQKYAKIMSNSINFIEVNSINNNTDIFIELKNIIKQYNKFIFSEKIKNFIFKEDFFQKNNNFLIKNTKNLNNFNFKEFEPKNLNFTEKFRTKISALKNEKCKIYDELNNCKKKNKFLALEKDEMEIEINKLKKENEALKSKIKNLENIEKEFLLQNNENNKLKGQIENLNIDIKNKENIINNLQQILEQIKLNSNIINTNYNRNNITKNNNKIENNKQNNESGFLSDINNDSIEKDIIAHSNLNINSIIENILNLDEDDDNKKDFKNIKINNHEEEQKRINKKMEKIDQDILDLKAKLKKIYSK